MSKPATKKVKTITSYTGLSRFMAQLVPGSDGSALIVGEVRRK